MFNGHFTLLQNKHLLMLMNIEQDFRWETKAAPRHALNSGVICQFPDEVYIYCTFFAYKH